ncbi:MAG TPA: hypothetical protein VN702_10230 [Acetobacteraceae bacterium]|nr:hypothetical protein [Acetobacteraceae bacterium]
MSLLPLFLVSLATVGFETALTRYFAVAKWSEYGYWVISITMVGFAFSGVLLALFRDWFARHGQLVLAALPALLVAAAAAGYRFTTTNPFNPLQLQNSATLQPQLWNIAGYYAALLPFFFLAGLFVSLSFVLNSRRISTVYAFDLAGAGLGAAATLAAMFLVDAFHLVPLLLIPLVASAVFLPRPRRWRAAAAALAVLAVSEAVLLLDDQAAYNDFKAIYAPLHTPDAKVVARVNAPRGDYALLDDFTERVDTDISNNAAMMGVEGPPRTFGLYRDGDRIAALPKPGKIDAGYATAALDALPYVLVPHANVLLAGASGGFRIAELRKLGAAHITVMEPEPVLARALRAGMGPSPPVAQGPDIRLTSNSPMAASRLGTYDVVDLSADFLDAAPANAAAFSEEAIAVYLRALAPGGVVSIPVSIRDFPVYALRVLGTARAALLAAGFSDPAAHVVVYRSAWDARILLSPQKWDAARIAAIRRFCDDRSFDLSWFPGIDVAAARAGLYNDLPAVSFDKGEVESSGPDDAIADEAGAVLDGRVTASSGSFNLSPVTLDRPFFYAILRLDQIGTLLKRLEILPQAEVGALVNLAVLAQAAVIAALVLAVPLLVRQRLRTAATLRGGLATVLIYFPALGLGFLFIEIALIEKASFWLDDRTSGFAVVLTGMLIFSGLGSMIAGRLSGGIRSAAPVAALVVALSCLGLMLWLEPLMLATLAWPWPVRAGLVILTLAPVSIALGMPFPLGLTTINEGALLPWAWALNGAFSVVATPLANLTARAYGFSAVLICAMALYVVVMAVARVSGRVRLVQAEPPVTV